jgi:hypothetical protein
MTELSRGYPTNPPRFRRARATPAETTADRCETCDSFSGVGYCVRYQLPVFPHELCDSYVSIFKAGDRQATTK